MAQYRRLGCLVIIKPISKVIALAKNIPWSSNIKSGFRLILRPGGRNNLVENKSSGTETCPNLRHYSSPIPLSVAEFLHFTFSYCSPGISVLMELLFLDAQTHCIWERWELVLETGIWGKKVTAIEIYYIWSLRSKFVYHDPRSSSNTFCFLEVWIWLGKCRCGPAGVYIPMCGKHLLSMIKTCCRRFLHVRRRWFPLNGVTAAYLPISGNETGDHQMPYQSYPQLAVENGVTS